MEASLAADRTMIPFSKWHALGNAYLVVERQEVGEPLAPELARVLCDVHFGVGSDGVLEVVATDGPTAEVVIWNPDGSTAEMSGNGTRIAAAWLSQRVGADETRVRVGSRSVSARRRGDMLFEQDLGIAEVGESEILELEGGLAFTPVSIGNPHAVIRREPDRGELLRLGPLVERHPRFAERTNVQLVRVDGRHEATAAVWERGAGETLASGSSACAVAAAAVARGWADSPVTVHLPGGDLLVEVNASFSVRLTGPAEEICRGELALRSTPRDRTREASR